jgi:hypothetical protein
MNGFYLLWATGGIVAFLALRSLALRDFGVVTVAGLIGLVSLSLVAGPIALVMALGIFLMGDDRDTIWSKPVWTKDR